MATLSNVSQRISNQNGGVSGAAIFSGSLIPAVDRVTQEIRLLGSRVQSMESTIEVDAIANELTFGETELIREELHKLNETSKAILKAVTPSLDDLETMREASRKRSFITNGVPSFSAPGPMSTSTGGGMGGFAAGAAAAGITSNMGRFRSLLGIGARRILPVAAGLYASHEAGDFVSEITGSESLGDVTSFTGYGATLGSVIPGVGTLAGAGIGALVGLAKIGNDAFQEMNDELSQRLTDMYGEDALGASTDFIAANGVAGGTTEAFTEKFAESTPAEAAATLLDESTFNGDFNNMGAINAIADRLDALYSEAEDLLEDGVTPGEADRLAQILTEVAQTQSLLNNVSPDSIQGSVPRENFEFLRGEATDILNDLSGQFQADPTARTIANQVISGSGATGSGAPIIINNNNNGGGSTPAAPSPAPAPLNLSSTDTRFHYGGR